MTTAPHIPLSARAEERRAAAASSARSTAATVSVAWPVSRAAAERALGCVLPSGSVASVEVAAEFASREVAGVLVARTKDGAAAASRVLWTSAIAGRGATLTVDPCAGLVHLDAPGRVRITLALDDGPAARLVYAAVDTTALALPGGTLGVPFIVSGAER